MDSVTRLAMAQREIGWPPASLPVRNGLQRPRSSTCCPVCSRARAFPARDRTGFFTVLVEGDDFNEPIADAVRSILDGHIACRELGSAGHYPAIDILNSP